MVSRYRRLDLMFLPIFILISNDSVLSSAQSTQERPAVLMKQAMAYANNSEGLQSLVEDILHAAKSKDTARETELIQSLLVPEDSKWFSEEFGAGFGASLSKAYRRLTPNLESDLQVVFENDMQRGWMKPKIFRYSDAASTDFPVDNFFNSMNEVIPLYQTAINGNRTTFGSARDPNLPGRVIAGDPHGYFVFVEGGFRFIPQEVLMMLPHGRPVRIKLSMDLMNSKIINRTPMQVPPEAMRKHISGKVVVELILDVDGEIRESKLLEGDPILGNSVIEAVRKWKFEPTKLDGDPVEVDIEISIVFQVN
jgi:TonB family protein